MGAPTSRATGAALELSPTSEGLTASRSVTLADELLTALGSIRRSARRRANRPVMLSSLTGSQLEVVRLVRLRPGVSVTQVAQALQLAPNTVSSLVGQLTEAGVLLRRADEADRRVARLDLAPDTRSQVHAWLDRRVLAVSTAIESLSRADQQRLAESLSALRCVADYLGIRGSEE